MYVFIQTGISIFQNLDERINYVATKVIHVGDQLESINTPRSRAVQVHKLIGYLEEFMSAGPLSIDIFNDPTKVKTFLLDVNICCCFYYGKKYLCYCNLNLD